MLKMMNDLVATSYHPAWGLAFLSLLLKIYKDMGEGHTPQEARFRMEQRVENLRECTRNLLTQLGPRLESMSILWSVCSAFRILIADDSEERLGSLTDGDLVAALDGCPATGAVAGFTKESFHVLERCRYLGALSDEVHGAVLALRAWRSFAYQDTCMHGGLELQLEEIQLFYEDIAAVVNLLLQNRQTAPPSSP